MGIVLWIHLYYIFLLEEAAYFKYITVFVAVAEFLIVEFWLKTSILPGKKAQSLQTPKTAQLT